ncbi:helix-turn-helix domain-containing protein [Cytobacillus praedii]|uniref:helix-turn-helix domain-containing protein n=1 Tax=Cytobacillus praedii TaxID=1742358 RepID=UPI002E23FBA0|nr:helix-turn-helix domain-containing protein [Cytobacillus praedii]
MSNYQIGQAIYDLRIQMNISQSELAKGICSQSFISRIEKGEISPSAELLYSLSKKLGVDINYYFKNNLNPRFDYQLSFCKQVRDYVQKADYEPVRELIKIESKNPYFNNEEMKQFIIWHQGICAYHIDGDLYGAILYLKKAFNLLGGNKKKLNGCQLEIAISIANIYNEEKCYKEAINYYNLAINRLNEIKGFIDNKILIRALYNYSKLLYRMDRDKEAVENSSTAIQLCLELESNYLLGNLLYQNGLSLEKLGETKNALHKIEDAYSIFRIQNNYPFASHVKRKINNLKTKVTL